MDYGKIISSCIDILKDKTILFWAFITTLLSAGSLNFEIGDFESQSTELEGMFGETFAILAFIIFILVFTLILIGINIYFGNIARISLIESTKKKIKQIKSELTINESYEWGKEKWFKLFLMRVILIIPSILMMFGLIALIIFGISMFENTGPENITIVILLFCSLIIVLVPILFILGILNTFGERSLVLKSLEPLDALRDGWRFFVNNFKDLFVSYLVAFGISLAISIPLFFLMAIIGIPFGFILFGLMTLNNIYLSIVLGLIISILLWIINSIIMTPLNAFTSIYWTNIYMKLNKLN